MTLCPDAPSTPRARAGGLKRPRSGVRLGTTPQGLDTGLADDAAIHDPHPAGAAVPATAGGVLVVDLDGTLIRSDMLYETFWAGFALDWRTPLWALAGLLGGRAALKARMAALANPDPATLPYEPEVLDLIARWRAAGGKAVLATAADHSVAQAIAAHLGCFDAVHATENGVNLKGRAKAALLDRLYGPGRYTYAGDSGADMAVWQQAGAVVTVGAGPALAARAGALHPDPLHLAPPRGQLRPALKAMRPHQWLKNLLIFLPLVAAHRFDALTVTQAGLAFVAFSLVASSVYLLNDLMDLAADRVHPRKCRRPLASGALPLRTGMALFPALLVVGLAVAVWLGPGFVAVLGAYYALTVGYSLVLKRKALVDIAALATLYALRVVAGGVATGIELSVWLVAFSVFLFFALASVKRQAELVDLVARGRTEVSGRGYSTEDMPVIRQMGLGAGFISVLVLMLYIQEPKNQAAYANPDLLMGVCLILLYWVCRMVLLANRGQMDDDPVVFAVRDRVSLVCGLLTAALVAGAILW